MLSAYFLEKNQKKMGFFKKSPKNLLTHFLKFYKIRTVQLRDTTIRAKSTLLVALIEL